MKSGLSIVIVAALAGAGCKQQAAEEAAPAYMTSGASSAGPTAVAPDPNALPAWMPLVEKSLRFVGKSKVDFVEAFGEPERAVKHAYSGDGFYELSAANTAVLASFNSRGIIDAITLRFKPRVLAGEVWQSFGNPSAAPKAKDLDQDTLLRFWTEPADFRRTDDDVPGTFEKTILIDFSYTFPDGKTLLYQAFSQQPPIKGEIKFNPQTDRREFISTSKNPLYSWKLAKVRELTFQAAK